MQQQHKLEIHEEEGREGVRKQEKKGKNVFKIKRGKERKEEGKKEGMMKAKKRKGEDGKMEEGKKGMKEIS